MPRADETSRSRDLKSHVESKCSSTLRMTSLVPSANPFRQVDLPSKTVSREPLRLDSRYNQTTIDLEYHAPKSTKAVVAGDRYNGNLEINSQDATILFPGDKLSRKWARGQSRSQSPLSSQ